MFVVLFALWLLELATGPSGPITVARHTMGIAYVSFVVVIILATVFSTRQVSVDTIAAALCVYLLLAIIWAEVYSLMEMANPGSFHVSTATDPDVPLQLGGFLPLQLFPALSTLDQLLLKLC